MKTIAFISQKKIIILGILFLAWVLGSFNKIVISIVAIPLTEEFSLAPNQIGLIMSSFFLSYAVMSLFGGVLADKFGHRSVLTTMMLLWSVLTAATATVWNFSSMVAARFILGAAEGGFGPASSVVLAEEFPKEERGRAKSCLVSAAVLGMGLGGLITAVMLVKFNWRLVFLLFGILEAIFSILFYLVIRNHKGNPSPAEKRGNKYSFKSLFRFPLIFKLGLISFGAGITNWGLTSWLPNYWVNIHGLNMIQMGMMTVISYICTFVFMQVSGFVLDKFMVGYEKYILFGGSVLVALFILLMMKASTTTQAIICLSIAFAAMGFVLSTMLVLPLKYLPVQMVGSATGFVNFMQRMAGIIAPAIMGFLIAEYDGSYTPVFVFVIMMIIVSAAAALTIKTKVTVKQE